MEVVNSIKDLREHLAPLRTPGRSIGFVPTMGYLHAGHVSLMRRARSENDAVVVSVFVNPTQFGPTEDLEAYPRDTQGDLNRLIEEQIDVAFFPTVDELYPEGFTTYVQVEGPMTQALCGRSRPSHFRGVTTIVAKLFHLVQPRRAYFGQKDAQQVAVLNQMVRDLNFDIEMVVCPTVREADGLAMSSRNAYLTSLQRAQAPDISQSLFQARHLIQKGERDAQIIVDYLKKRILAIDSAVIDYVSIVDARSLMELSELTGMILIAVAVYIGRTRLIDNIEVEV